MRIADVLAGKGATVAVIAPDALVRHVVEQLAEQRVGALVVSGDGRRIEGIVSERDIVRGLRSDERLLERRVDSIMSTEVSTCSPEDDTDSLMAIMTDRRIRHVPVVEDGELAGIVSIGDVVKTRIGELERERKDLFDYITAR